MKILTEINVKKVQELKGLKVLNARTRQGHFGKNFFTFEIRPFGYEDIAFARLFEVKHCRIILWRAQFQKKRTLFVSPDEKCPRHCPRVFPPPGPKQCKHRIVYLNIVQSLFQAGADYANKIVGLVDRIKKEVSPLMIGLSLLAMNSYTNFPDNSREKNLYAQNEERLFF